MRGRLPPLRLAQRRGRRRAPPALRLRVQRGERVWLDTGEAELADTAILYAPAFSPSWPTPGSWGDAVAILFPAQQGLQQRALASPPWRYLAGLELHAPHPEYGLGLDFWPGLLRDGFRSHPGSWAPSG